MKIRMKLHTGPTQVHAVADRLDGLAKVRVTARGTEHVYVEAEAGNIWTAKDLVADGAGLPYLRNAVVSWAHAAD